MQIKQITIGATVEITEAGELHNYPAIVTAKKGSKWSVEIPGIVGAVELPTKSLRVIG